MSKAFTMEERLMQRKHILFTCIIIASVLLSACATTTPTTVATEAPPVVSETEAPPEVVPTEVAPTEAPPAEKTVATITWTQEFDSLNPAYTNMWFSTTTQQLWNAWAWEFDDKSEPFPRLVTEIPSVDNGGISEDGKTITMTLRSDVVWSDGTPLTSTDFKFTQEMYVSPNNAVNSAYPYSEIESIDTPDDQTVVIHFTNPFAPWLSLLWHGILPAHILQPVYDADGTLDEAEWNSAPTVGLGPYVFDTWESGSFARFVKNDNYWGEPAKIDEIFFRFVPDDAAQVASLQAGDADLGYWYSWTDAKKLEDAGFTIVVVPNGYDEGLFFLIDNIGAGLGNPAMMDVKVRQALAMAIDRESLNQTLNLGYVKVPASFWDGYPFYNDPPIVDYKYDPAAAEALLDEAGWVDSNGDGTRDKDGVELVLRYGTTNKEIRQSAQVVIKEQLEAVGIGVELSSLESDLYFASYDNAGPAATGQLDIMEWSDAPLFPDPDIYYWLCDEIPTDEYPAGSNWFFVCDEELDALIKLQQTQVNVDERKQTISQINQMFHDKVYWLGLWQDPDPWAVGPRLQNTKFSPVNPFYNIAEWTIAP
jgi:peptide/nickel transport system substrate-binding protein